MIFIKNFFFEGLNTYITLQQLHMFTLLIIIKVMNKNLTLKSLRYL